MKLILSLILAAVSLPTFARNDLSITRQEGRTTVEIGLDRQTVFAQKLIASIVKSPLVKFSFNYVRKYSGEGFALDLHSDIRATLSFDLNGSKNFEMGRSHITLDGKGALGLYETLVTSTSPHSITSATPNRTFSVGPNQVVVLESGNGFSGEYLTCTGAATTARCSIIVKLNLSKDLKISISSRA